MGAVCTGQSVPKKVLIIGPKSAGKTTCLYAWCSHLDAETVPTESFNVETVYGVKGGQLMLMWDVTDTQRRRQFFYGTDAVVYVVDGTDKASIASAETDLAVVIRERDLANLPLMLVVTKQDKSDISTEEVTERCLKITDLTSSGRCASVGVAKNNPSSYKMAIDKLCALLYS